jgi:hypothetical protein
MSHLLAPKTIAMQYLTPFTFSTCIKLHKHRILVFINHRNTTADNPSMIAGFIKIAKESIFHAITQYFLLPLSIGYLQSAKEQDNNQERFDPYHNIKGQSDTVIKLLIDW